MRLRPFTIGGFSLLEMSIVLIIIATLVGGGVAFFTASVDKQQRDITLQRMAAIQKALLDYRRAFQELPCPADGSALLTQAPFGRSVVGHTVAGDCLDTGHATTYGDGNIWGGAVPVRMLKLPDEYAFDGWGRRFMYYVDGEVTMDFGFTNSTVSDATGDFTIEDGEGTEIVGNALYVLVSHGPNGHGALTRLGTSRVNVGSTNDDEYENCNCGIAGTDNGSFDGAFVQKPYAVDDLADPTDIFDDIVVYGTRNQMRLLTE